MKKALLLRVGNDDFKGVLKEGNRFEWRCLSGHNDPNWEELSYGDCLSRRGNKAPKISQLIKLKEDDLLIFYSGLNKNRETYLGIVGYYVVKDIINFIDVDYQDEIFFKKRDELTKSFQNPHINYLWKYKPEDSRTHKFKKSDIIIFGKSGGLLEKAIIIGRNLSALECKNCKFRFFTGLEKDVFNEQAKLKKEKTWSCMLCENAHPKGYRRESRGFIFLDYYFLEVFGDVTQAGTGHNIRYDRIYKLLKNRALRIGSPPKYFSDSEPQKKCLDIWQELTPEELKSLLNLIKTKSDRDDKETKKNGSKKLIQVNFLETVYFLSYQIYNSNPVYGEIINNFLTERGLTDEFEEYESMIIENENEKIQKRLMAMSDEEFENWLNEI